MIFGFELGVFLLPFLPRADRDPLAGGNSNNRRTVISGRPGLIAGSGLKIEALEHDNIKRYQ
jgi:hypothetical protein